MSCTLKLSYSLGQMVSHILYFISFWTKYSFSLSTKIRLQGTAGGRCKREVENESKWYILFRISTPDYVTSHSQVGVGRWFSRWEPESPCPTLGGIPDFSSIAQPCPFSHSSLMLLARLNIFFALFTFSTFLSLSMKCTHCTQTPLLPTSFFIFPPPLTYQLLSFTQHFPFSRPSTFLHLFTLLFYRILSFFLSFFQLYNPRLDKLFSHSFSLCKVLSHFLLYFLKISSEKTSWNKILDKTRFVWMGSVSLFLIAYQPSWVIFRPKPSV